MLDSNVLAWVHYFFSGFSATGARIPQVPVYSPYAVQLGHVGSMRYRTGLSASELAHLIEQNELEGYSTVAGSMPLKDYRHNVHAERVRVVAEIDRVWGRIETSSTELPLTLDATTTRAALSRIGSAELDGHDLFILHTMLTAGVTQIVTDDGDFCTVAGIEVFTANARVLAAARAQGCLITR